MDKKPKLLTSKRKTLVLEYVLMALDDLPDSIPVYPEIIAESEGIKYKINDYNGDFSGLIEYLNGRFFIFLNSGNGETLQSPTLRYSFAHELGHYLIDNHRTELMQEGILQNVTMDPMLSDSVQEKEAEYFASCLLMPEHQYMKDIKGKPFSLELMMGISNKYKVSLTSAILRYATLGQEPLFVICSRPTEIKWKYRSRNFPFHKLRLSDYGNLAEGTQAGNFHYLAIRNFIRPLQAPALLWFTSSRVDELQRIFNEHCFNYHSNGEVISVIWEVKYGTSISRKS